MSAARYRVTAPNPVYSGATGKCQFSLGKYEGPVEEGTLLYFQQAGYAVEALNEAAADDLNEVAVEDLKGKALDQALAEAGLPTDGKADEKRARLAEFRESQNADGDVELKGAALDKALEDAGLPKTGTADEKRERLAEHLASHDNSGAGDGTENGA